MSCRRGSRGHQKTGVSNAPCKTVMEKLSTVAATEQKTRRFSQRCSNWTGGGRAVRGGCGERYGPPATHILEQIALPRHIDVRNFLNASRGCESSCTAAKVGTAARVSQPPWPHPSESRLSVANERDREQVSHAHG